MGVIAEAIQNPLVRSAAVVAAESLGIVAFTTTYNHRELTHDSLRLRPVLRGMARTAMRAIGMNPNIWASVHTVHHAMPDVNFAPIIETADFLEHLEKNPNMVNQPVPEAFYSLDPVAVLSPGEIKDVGDSARKLVEGRYDVPISYSNEEVSRLLDPVTPRYLYQERPGFLSRLFARNNPNPDEPALNKRNLEYLVPELRDPHSPALHRQGVRGLLFDNVALYAQAGEYFKNNAHRPVHLRQEVADHIAEHPKWGQRTLIIGNIAVAGAIFGGLTPLALAGHVLTGHIMTGAMASVLRLGGNLTNSFGHGGKRPIWSFLFNKGNPLVKADGTFATNAKSFSPLTLDEVGGQGPHHQYPGKIAYSVKKGFKKLAEAPFGTLLESLAKRDIGLSPGKGFELKPGEQRPDEPVEAAIKLYDARIRTMAGKVLEKTAG